MPDTSGPGDGVSTPPSDSDETGPIDLASGHSTAACSADMSARMVDIGFRSLDGGVGAEKSYTSDDAV